MPNESGFEIAEYDRVRELWNMLRRQKWLILAFVLVGTGAGCAYAITRRATYEARAVLRVDEKRLGLPSLDAAVPFATGNQVGAELEVLRSRELAAAIVDTLALQLRVVSPRHTPRSALLASALVDATAPAAEYQLERQPDGAVRVTSHTGTRSQLSFAPGDRVVLDGATLELVHTPATPQEFVISISPREDAIVGLRESLKIRQPSRETGVIHIEYAGADPEIVAAVPNALAAQFLAQRRRASEAETRGTIEYLRTQLDSIAVQLTATEQELRTFREDARVVDPQVERTAQITQIGGLQAERDALEAERQALASLVDEVQRSDAPAENAASPFRRLVAFPALLRNQAASDLIRSLVKVEDERAALITRRRPSDPEMLVLDARIGELESALQGTVTTYLTGLTNQVRAIDRQLAGYTNDLASIPAKEMKFAQLSRRAKLQEEIYSQLRTRLTEAEVAQSVQDLSVRVIDEAFAQLQPLRARQAIAIAFAFALSLLFGVGAGIVREYLDPSVHSRQDLLFATGGLPVLGMIPQIPHKTAPLRLQGRRAAASTALAALPPGRDISDVPGMLLNGNGAEPFISDAYQRLQMNVLWAGPAEGVHAVLFTSALPGEGKTTTAVNFSAALARRGQRVLLLDADLRRATMSQRLHAAGAPGVAQLLSAPHLLPTEAVQSIELRQGARLDFIPAGTHDSDPADLLDAARVGALMTWARSAYDVVVVDSPPTSVASEALFLGSWMDGVIFVTRASVTPADAVSAAVQEFRLASIPVIGTVLNDVHLEREARYDPAYRWYDYGKSYYGGAGKARRS